MQDASFTNNKMGRKTKQQLAIEENTLKQYQKQAALFFKQRDTVSVPRAPSRSRPPLQDISPNANRSIKADLESSPFKVFFSFNLQSHLHLKSAPAKKKRPRAISDTDSDDQEFLPAKPCAPKYKSFPVYKDEFEIVNSSAIDDNPFAKPILVNTSSAADSLAENDADELILPSAVYHSIEPTSTTPIAVGAFEYSNTHILVTPGPVNLGALPDGKFLHGSIDADGACLFSAISYALSESQSLSKAYRAFALKETSQMLCDSAALSIGDEKLKDFGKTLESGEKFDPEFTAASSSDDVVGPAAKKVKIELPHTREYKSKTYLLSDYGLKNYEKLLNNKQLSRGVPPKKCRECNEDMDWRTNGPIFKQRNGTFTYNNRHNGRCLKRGQTDVTLAFDKEFKEIEANLAVLNSKKEKTKDRKSQICSVSIYSVGYVKEVSKNCLCLQCLSMK